MARVAIYVRISADRGGTEAGVARQLEDCRALAERRGLEVAEVFQDNDVSAYTGRARPEWRRMLEALADGRVTHVVAWANDRLYRRTRDQLDLMEAVQGAGGAILTARDGEADPSTAEGQMRMTILASVAQFESKRKSERLVRKHAEIAGRGGWSGGGRRPFGYRVVGPRPFRLQVDSEEARAIRAVARAVLGGASLHSVVVAWNDGPRPMAKDSGSRWTVTDVRRVLLSEQVAGLRTYGGVTVEGTWPAILTREQHDLLRLRLGDPARRPVERDQRDAGRRYVLGGLVRCALCGQRMSGKVQRRRTRAGAGSTRRQYACSSSNGGCSRVAIASPGLERMVVEEAMARLGDEPEWGRPAAPAPDERAALREVRELEERRLELGRAFADGLMDAGQVKVATDAIAARVAELEGGLRASPPPARKDYLRDLGAFFDFLDGRADEVPPREAVRLNAALREVVERVEVAPARAQGVRFDPSRVTVRWRR